MLFLEKRLAVLGRNFSHCIGGRSKADLLTYRLSNCSVATEDGSEGLKGTVLDLLRTRLSSSVQDENVKVFACGPNAMLKAVAGFCSEHSISCEASLESVMGCGIVICYGCLVELNNADGEKETVLLCKEGPVVDGKRLVL
jgi:dihydroorotate dehydrogenase electron transfer subunit